MDKFIADIVGVDAYIGHYYCFSGQCGHRPLQNYSPKLQ